jgi:murein DD-endopeptidase MepM/ murein hydrolase activator NlpD
VSILLPFLQIEGFNNPFVASVSNYWEASNFMDHWVETSPVLEKYPPETSFFTIMNFQNILLLLYGLGVLILGIRFLLQVGYFCFLVLSNHLIRQNNYQYILVKEPNYAAAFMHYIIISKNIWESEDKLLITQHECKHVDLWHSTDRFLTEILCVFQWFNPFIYWFRKELIAVHEFQVDQAIVASGIDRIQYQQLIAQYATSSNQFRFGNHFSHSLTLNRIKMIAQNKSFHSFSAYRILLLIPVVGILVSLFAFQIPNTVRSYTPTVFTENNGFILPIEKGKFQKTVDYGMRMHAIKKIEKLHTGVDFIAPLGTPILTVQNASIIRVQHSDKGYGNNVIIQIDEKTQVMYAHMDKIEVEVNQKVTQGTLIGTVGSTGMSTKPHLHFEVVEDGKKVDPKGFLPTY